VSTQELLVAVDRLVRSVPRGDLHTLVTELGRGFAGTGPELRALLVSTRRLVRSANAALPATGRLIARGGRVLDTQNDVAGDITTFANGLARFTDALRSGDHDLRRVIERAVPAARQVSALERDVGTTLPALLDDLTGLGHVVEPRVAALRQILVIYPYVVSTSFGLFPGNGSTRFGVPIPPAEDHQPCKKGYLDPSKRRLPTALDYPPIRWNSFCKESTKADVAVRGARMAPQPDGSRLGDDPSYDANTGLPGGTMTRSWRWLLLGDFF
jgi:phospholipid/cholesterol/gamma-HCH transport system substrate-binding protein